MIAMKPVTFEDVYLSATRLAEERPDFSYDRFDGACAYAIDGEPDCYVGHIWYEIDRELFNGLVGQDDMNIYQMGHTVTVGAGTSDSVIAPYGDEGWRNSRDGKAVGYFLSELQGNQDTGAPWGEALNMATRNTVKVYPWVADYVKAA